MEQHSLWFWFHRHTNTLTHISGFHRKLIWLTRFIPVCIILLQSAMSLLMVVAPKQMIVWTHNHNVLLIYCFIVQLTTFWSRCIGMNMEWCSSWITMATLRLQTHECNSPFLRTCVISICVCSPGRLSVVFLLGTTFSGLPFEWPVQLWLLGQPAALWVWEEGGC